MKNYLAVAIEPKSLEWFTTDPDSGENLFVAHSGEVQS